MNETDRPALITLGFDEPDHAGHDDGPSSEEVWTLLKGAPSIVMYLCFVASITIVFVIF